MIKKFLLDETGLELSEYAVGAAMIAIAAVAAFKLLGESIGDRIEELDTKINE
jgi:Flp pilus assembly pilin Flp